MIFIKTDNNDSISGMRSALYQKLTAPIDAMWELLYIASAKHYLINEEDKVVGYCCVTEENCLVQLYLEEAYCYRMNNTIQELIDTKIISSARLSSNEPIAFNTCLALAKSVTPNTLCFERTNGPIGVDSKWNIVCASSSDIPVVKRFLKEEVGMDDTFGYTENLISRKELFVIKEKDEIIATSERRISDTQSAISDIGIIVKKDYQGKGIASAVMQMQVNRVLQEGRRPICSTTVDNIASQKAIERAGFYCSNIIFEMILGEATSM